MVYEFLVLLVESYGTWLLLQRLVDASKESDIPKNVPFAFAINNRNITSVTRPRSEVRATAEAPLCGDETRAVLSHGGTGVDDTRNMGTRAKLRFITTPNDFVPQFFLCFARVWVRA
jgi:hypothetical protein